MTRYEHGFLTKCAEYGIDGRPLLKKAVNGAGAAALGALGGGAGGLIGSIPQLALLAAGGGLGAAMAPRDKETRKKKRLLGALIGMALANPIVGTTAGAVGGGIVGYKTNKAIKALQGAQNGQTT